MIAWTRAVYSLSRERCTSPYRRRLYVSSLHDMISPFESGHEDETHSKSPMLPIISDTIWTQRARTTLFLAMKPFNSQFSSRDVNLDANVSALDVPFFCSSAASKSIRHRTPEQNRATHLSHSHAAHMSQ